MKDNKISVEESKTIRSNSLSQRQSLPLNSKIATSKRLIREFHNKMNGKTYVAYSGGKDSTVLLHLVRSLYPKTPAVFIDTGLEYPELKEFVKETENVTTVRPSMNFRQVIKKYGYPIISKATARKIRELQNPHKGNRLSRHLYATGEKQEGRTGEKALDFKLPKKWINIFKIKKDKEIGYYSDFHDFKVSEQCCNIMKKKPTKKYTKETGRYPYIGTMANDSQQRRASYVQTGCNTYKGAIRSRPLSIWKRKDIWKYIHKYNLSYSKIYDMGVTNTGCIYCMFGCHMESEPNRFQAMARTHPKLYKYCMNNLGIKKVLKTLNIPYKKKPSLDDY